MKEEKKFRCWICGEKFDYESAAVECTQKGISLPCARIGDKVFFQSGGMGDGKSPRHGRVLDILFPVFHRPKCRLIGHRSGFVSYLVRLDEPRSFFDQERIRRLRRVLDVVIVGEQSVELVNMRDLVRDVARSWDQYAARVIKRNPRLRDRLDRYTAELRRIGSIP